MHLTNAAKRPLKAPKVPFWHDHFAFSGTITLKLPKGEYAFVIERGMESKPSVPTTTSWVSRAVASLSPTEAYSGSMKLPSGLTSGGRARPRGRAFSLSGRR